MRCLELCAGTQSFSKMARKMGHSSVTVDMNPKSNPDIVADVRKLVGQFKKGQFDFIWASPPCTGYSIANNLPLEKRNMPYWDGVARACLKIIEQVKPKYYCVENPVGLMRHRPFIKEWTNKGLDTVSYCMYGKPYRKNTDFWNNITAFEGKKCHGDCGKIRNGKHIATVQSGTSSSSPGQKSTPSLNDRYSLPPALVRAVIKAAEGKK